MSNPEKSLLPGKKISRTAEISRYVSNPRVTLMSIAIAIGLGLSHLPFVEKLRPLGDLYLALLQMSVLPFLLAAIPLALRSAIKQGAASHVLVRLVIWLCVSLVLASVAGIGLSSIVFSVLPVNA
jgi:Na+/H+-dicarboxylate symporter